MRTPPPLPSSTPPLHISDMPSADEVSELDEDELYAIRAQSRGQSVEPEMLFAPKTNTLHKPKPTRTSRSVERILEQPSSINLSKAVGQSLDSIPDDSGFQDPMQNSRVKQKMDENPTKVLHLERQLKAARLTVGTQSDLIHQVCVRSSFSSKN